MSSIRTIILGRIKSSTLVDVFAGYDWDRFNAELFVANLS